MKSLMRMVAAAAAVSALSAVAQDDDFDFDVGGDDIEEQAIEAVGDDDAVGDSEDADGDEAADGEESVKPKKDKPGAKLLKTLPFCYRLEGKAEVLKPGSTAWSAVEEGKFYPLGSAFRTLDNTSTVQIQFGDSEDVSVEIKDYVSTFTTRYQPLGEKTRAISLQGGVVTVKTPRNMPDGAFTISTPGFEVKNLKGMSRYAYTRTVDGEVAQIRCLTGTLAIEGRNFFFPEVKTACEVKIRTSQDQLFTGLYGNRGDSIVRLDQGEKRVKDFATGETNIEKKPLEWKLSPKTAVRIHRAIPDIGERMSVTVMTFDATGALRNRCAFTEGCCEVNTGELGPVAAEAKEDAAKKAAAEAAEVESVEVDVEEDDSDSSSSSDDSGDAGSDDAGSDDAGSGEASGSDDDFEF